ncbi:hypothetical protein O181_127300 [Austropuccinia psidii MF-1]|uniref:Uncharacterized protein n=1 Tax=Austropuccinia psidii MF-1 TaxID=1389203 RepID=A0A9Q3Q7X6_9BASI|nr:hypothetical protein [Austropuccinia psidii MF-1]
MRKRSRFHLGEGISLAGPFRNKIDTHQLQGVHSLKVSFGVSPLTHKHLGLRESTHHGWWMGPSSWLVGVFVLTTQQNKQGDCSLCYIGFWYLVTLIGAAVPPVG